MTMTLTETRNIHFQRFSVADAAAAESTPMEAPRLARRSMPDVARYRKVPRSPDEEFRYRVQKHGTPIHFSQAVIALVLQKQSFAEVGPSGVSITYQKAKYKFWHENSPTCCNKRGEKVLCTYDPDDMSFIHVLTEDGIYVESIPQKNKIAWFDDAAMKSELQKKQRSINRDMKHFQEIHKPTSESKINRILSNAEKMQIVNTIPAPEGSSAQGDQQDHAAEGRFPKADRLSRASEAISGQRFAHEEQRSRIRTTTARAANLLDSADKEFEEEFEEPATARRFTAANLL